MKTHQEIFDFVARFMITQGKPSQAENWTCAYRGDDGCRCAVGIFIPDHLYDPTMEGKSIDVLLTNWNFSGAEVLHRDNLLLLQRLQGANDTATMMYLHRRTSFLAFFKQRMLVVAKDFGLDAAVLDAIDSES